jgi:peptidoglycan hydrolase-like protein with peptidoglycan-binding domain
MERDQMTFPVVTHNVRENLNIAGNFNEIAALCDKGKPLFCRGQLRLSLGFYVSTQAPDNLTLATIPLGHIGDLIRFNHQREASKKELIDRNQVALISVAPLSTCRLSLVPLTIDGLADAVFGSSTASQVIAKQLKDFVPVPVDETWLHVSPIYGNFGAVYRRENTHIMPLRRIHTPQHSGYLAISQKSRMVFGEYQSIFDFKITIVPDDTFESSYPHAVIETNTDVMARFHDFFNMSDIPLMVAMRSETPTPQDIRPNTRISSELASVMQGVIYDEDILTTEDYERMAETASLIITHGIDSIFKIPELDGVAPAA